MSEKPNQEPNPHESSALPPQKIQEQYSIRAEDDKCKDVIRDSGGREFFRINRNKYGADQMLISRLLKGVVAVSDVVFIKDGDGNGNYYSYKLPLEHAPQIPDIKEQMNRAYIEELICCAVFTDYDHGVGELRKDMHNFTSGNKNFTFFDFDQATYFWRYAGQKVAHAALRIKHHIGTDGVKVFVQKLDELEDRFRSSFLQDVVASIEKNNGDIPVIIKEAPGDNKIESFRQEVLRRIIELKTALESNPSNN